MYKIKQISDTMTHIYVLKNPITMEIKYIGKSNHPKKRYKQHLYHALKNNNKRDIWIRELLNQNKKPIMEIIDIVDKNNWVKKEIEYIETFRKHHADLTNETNIIKTLDKEIIRRLLDD